MGSVVHDECPAAASFSAGFPGAAAATSSWPPPDNGRAAVAGLANNAAATRSSIARTAADEALSRPPPLIFLSLARSTTVTNLTIMTIVRAISLPEMPDWIWTVRSNRLPELSSDGAVATCKFGLLAAATSGSERVA